MPDWTLIAAVGIGLLLILCWIGLEEPRRRWKRSRTRRRCAHRDPCLEGTYRSPEPGWARQVYYCPDCKHLWARRLPITPEEWERLQAEESA
jgi:hypothetical protein